MRPLLSLWLGDRLAVEPGQLPLDVRSESFPFLNVVQGRELPEYLDHGFGEDWVSVMENVDSNDVNVQEV